MFLQTQMLFSQSKSFIISGSSDYNETGNDIIELIDEKSYVVCGIENKVGSSRFLATFYKFTDEGAITDSAMLSFPGKSIYMHEILDGYNDSLIFVGMLFDTGKLVSTRQDLSLVLFITDLSLNPIDTLFYPYPIPDNYYFILTFLSQMRNE